MSGIVLDRAEDRPYGPGNPDYEYDKWRNEMDEKLTAAEREFEEWKKGKPLAGLAKAAYLAADARATERTARRCVELGNADAIAKEFGLD